uniref:F-box domain-containing protein n=1 Tax=Oryza brachyantha TaxID=4533 RepID=J3N7C1_ORYBR
MGASKCENSHLPFLIAATKFHSDAMNMFDRMPAKSKKAAMAGGGGGAAADHISALPDELLQHLLSFLPSREALNTFVRHLLLRRERVPLHECELDSFRNGEVARWYRYAVSCRAQVLRVDTAHSADYSRLPETAIASDRLTRLEFGGVQLGGSSLDLSGCPKLEALEMQGCKITVEKILSPSVKRLSITRCNFELDSRTRVSAPSLVYLELADIRGWTPLLGCMASLSTAFVRLDDRCEDYCLHSYYGDCGDTVSCGNYCTQFYDVYADDCVLLGGLSNVTNLELLTSPEVFIVRKDLLMNPTFSKLKTLLLNVWDADANLGPLVYILRHSPVLEKLTLHLHEEPKAKVEMDESNSPDDELMASKHLKVVEVRYSKRSVLRRVLRILNTYGVPPEKINTERMDLGPFGSYFSFEQTE